jgi:hypothetical protein
MTATSSLLGYKKRAQLMQYSKNTGGFYSVEIHGDNIPSDAVIITDDVCRSLLAAQSEGKVIVADEDGFPQAIEPPLVTIIPVSVTPKQARLALLDAGLLATVETAIGGMTGDDGIKARISWEWAMEIRRDDPLLVSLATTLGLSSEQIDQLFLAAQGL